MKSATWLFRLATVLAPLLVACGSSPSPTFTRVARTPVSALSTPTPVLPTLTPVSLAPTPARPTIIPTSATMMVTRAADAGPGTLRQALLDAKHGDIILFDPKAFLPTSPMTITLAGSLPEITQGSLTIDASNAGVILDGSRVRGDWVNGLSIRSDGNTVRGLQIINFPGSGIFLGGGAKHNTIGGKRGVGASPLGQGNLSSGNLVGIDLQDEGTSFNTITGNLIGTDVDGVAARGNRQTGIYVAKGASRNMIGPTNIIAYNAEGIQIADSKSLGNTITQNSIHDNTGSGVVLNDAGNRALLAPLIIDYDLAAGTVSGFACARCTVEIFSDDGMQGKIYEGQGRTDAMGVFTFEKGTSFTGPHLTATATDIDGNTSRFAQPTLGTRKSLALQEGNNRARTKLQPKRSGELADNRIGTIAGSLWHLEPEVFPSFVLEASHVLDLGLKRFRLTINNLDANKVDWSKPEFSIDPRHDAFITTLAQNGVAITYVLSFWDIAYKNGGGSVPMPRFRTEDEVQRYLEFVRFIVHHFKGRIEYYEIWNEPNLTDRIQWIEAEDYINLVRQVAPVIRQAYPQAKIVVGGTSSLIDPDSQAYLFKILRADIMPLVDVVSWHPMYGSSPAYDWHREYYYAYPSIVSEIKDVASTHGFTGEFVADEIHWNTPDLPEPPWPTYSETQSAKYLSRSIVMHLGLDVSVTQILLPDKLLLFRTNQNLCASLAGAEPTSLPIEIQSVATNIRSYGFSLPNGDRLLSVWTDGVAVDDDPGVTAILSVPGLSAQRVTGIDILNGFEQPLITNVEGGKLVIRNLLIKDYPIILRFAGVQSP